MTKKKFLVNNKKMGLCLYMGGWVDEIGKIQFQVLLTTVKIEKGKNNCHKGFNRYYELINEHQKLSKANSCFDSICN